MLKHSKLLEFLSSINEVIGKIKPTGHQGPVDQKFQRMILFDYYVGE